MVERVFGGEERRGEVEVARGDEQVHVRVLNERAAQRRADVGEPGGRRAPLPALDATAKNVIRQVGLIAELGADVVVKGAGEGRADAGFARVVIGPLADAGNVNAFEAAVEPADRALFVAQ